jgi:replicative DNA helicase
LYRESYYKREEEEKATEVTEVLISKHRNGATGSVNLAFERNINAFYNISEPSAGQGQNE